MFGKLKEAVSAMTGSSKLNGQADLLAARMRYLEDRALVANRYEQGLRDIIQGANNSHTQSMRSRWIVLRAQSALEGTDAYKSVRLPKSVDSELLRCKRKISTLTFELTELKKEKATEYD
jgi:hypothetical protein